MEEVQRGVYLEQSPSEMEYLRLDGEHMLMYAVLERALKTVTARTDSTTDIETMDALSWLMGIGAYASDRYNTYVFSANMICSYLNINYERLKDRLTYWVHENEED